VQAQETTADIVLTQRMDSLEIVAGGLAHEINNPLNYLKNALTRVRMDAEALLSGRLGKEELPRAEKRMREMFDLAESGIRRIAATVELMTSYSKAGYSRQLRPYDVFTAVREVVSLVVPATGRAVQVDLDLNGDGTVECVPEEFNQVISNLVQNAIAAMPEGGPLRPEMLKAPGTNGNGPFRVSDTTKDQITLAPNNSYWGGRPTLSTIVFTFGSDAAAVTRYRAGELDLVVDPPDPLSADIVKVPELTTFWVDFNVERAPFQDSRVRQAFATAVDRQALVSDEFKGRAEAATSLVPRGMNGYHPEDGKPQETNATAAKQQLDGLGVPRAQLTGLPMIVHDRPLDRAIAEALASQWSKTLGVSVSIQPLNPVDYGHRLRAGDFALAGPTGWTADYPDPRDFFDLFRSNDGNNGARWRNARYDAVVRVADIESDETKRDALYNQAHQLLESDTPVAFLVQRWHWSLEKPYVKGAPVISVDEWPGASYSNLLYVAAH